MITLDVDYSAVDPFKVVKDKAIVDEELVDRCFIYFVIFFLPSVPIPFLGWHPRNLENLGDKKYGKPSPQL
ncbi:hypothetical protein VNO78_27240 [Psophocarpus tetragonolobus]|uniref:Uncharacterized protein n=1 Tax=Psophocarpus tetragonolobus TaxID=3891 RepID=A0AAN9S0Y5_PSOTE